MSKNKPSTRKLAPTDVRRYLEDGECKADLKGVKVLRVLADVAEYGRRASLGEASQLELEAFWQRLYLVLTEIERDHRKLASFAIEMLRTAPDHRGLSWTVAKATPVVHAHDGFRSALTDAELLLVDFRRHSASHVSVDAYRIGLGTGGLLDGSKVTILGGRSLSVAEQWRTGPDDRDDPLGRVCGRDAVRSPFRVCGLHRGHLASMVSW